MLAVGLGHEVPSVLAVVAAFFGGFALGGWTLDRAVSQSAAPGRWYAALEILIGGWALVTIELIPWLNDRVGVLTGTEPTFARHWFIAFGLPFAALLPATTAMGATLPAMDRVLARLLAERRAVGGLYAANTLGAVAGTLGATFALVPRLGCRQTILIFASLNFACAFAMLMSSSRSGSPSASAARLAAPARRLRLGITIFVTGFLGIGYEVLGVRVMAQVLENRPRASFGRLLGLLLVALASACLLGVLLLSQSPVTYAAARWLFGGGFGGSIAAEMALALLVFFLPSVLMGATFSHLAQAARREEGGLGRALCLNTLGGAVAPFVFGVVLLPALRAKATLIILALCYLTIVPSRRHAPFVPVVFLLALVPWRWARLDLVEPPLGGRLIGYFEGVMAAVAVVEDPARNRLQKVNNRFYMGGTDSVFAQRRQAHLPLLLHPDPRRALFLGLGTGITFGGAADHPNLVSEGVELIPEVVETFPFFAPENRDPRNHPRLLVRVADARRYVRAASANYDVIVADLFHPARDGAGSLYTVEHFRAIRARLAAGGLFCQWLPLYQHDLESLRIIIRTFLDVFPDSRAYLADFNVRTPALALVGTTAPIAYDAAWLTRRVRSRALGMALEQLALDDELDLFGTLVATPEELEQFANDAPSNSDDRTIITYRAPRVAYATPPLAPYENLLALLEAFDPPPGEPLAPGGRESNLVERLGNYRAARDLYLTAETLREQNLADQALASHLESVRTSADFATTYAVLIDRARRAARSDPAGARRVLIELQRARPERKEAAALLRQLFRE